MKKLLFILCLVYPIIVTCQDQSVDELPAKTALSGAATEYFYLLDGSTDKHFTGSALCNLLGDSVLSRWNMAVDSFAAIRAYAGALAGGEGYWTVQQSILADEDKGYSYTIYPKEGLHYLKGYFGGDPGTSFNDYMLSVVGKSRFTDTLIAEEKIRLGSYSWIRDSSHAIWFKDDVTSGWKSLGDLLALPTTLTGSWTLNKGIYDIVFTDGAGNGITWHNATNVITLKSLSAYIDLDAPYTKADSLFADQIGAEKTTTDTLCVGADCITSLTAITGGGIGGTYVPGSSNDQDTIWVAAISDDNPQYDGSAGDTIDYIPLIDDENTKMLCVEYPITSANILAGDSLTILAAASGFAYLPVRYVLSMDAGGTPYTGSENSKLYLGGTTLATSGYATINSSSDGQRTSALFSGDSAGDLLINKAITFSLGNHDTGNGTAKLYVWYYKFAAP